MVSAMRFVMQLKRMDRRLLRCWLIANVFPHELDGGAMLLCPDAARTLLFRTHTYSPEPEKHQDKK
jgi:hypothetical protein